MVSSSLNSRTCVVVSDAISAKISGPGLIVSLGSIMNDLVFCPPAPPTIHRPLEMLIRNADCITPRAEWINHQLVFHFQYIRLQLLQIISEIKDNRALTTILGRRSQGVYIIR
jgi:hypothetical protein